MRYLAVLLVLSVTGCASIGSAPSSFWSLSQCADRPGKTHRIVDKDKKVIADLDTEYCAKAKTAATNIQRVSNQRFSEIYLTDRDELNAYSTYDKNREPIVIVTLRMLNSLRGDEAAWGALMGHELAHLSKHHGDGRQSANVGSQVVGNAIALAVPGIGGWLAGTATMNAAYGAYTRPQESEADDLGLEWMIAAGYDPQGMKRLVTTLSMQSTIVPEFFSTHPSTDDRFERAWERYKARAAR